MTSMTGYGKGIAERGGIKITVEIKSVNHRFLDLTIKSPKSLAFADETVRKAIKSRINRGHLDVYVGLESENGAGLRVCLNTELATQYFNAAKALSALFDIENDLTVSALMRTNDVLQIQESDTDENEMAAALSEACEKAVDALCVMREAEGANLKADLAGKAEGLKVLIAEAESRAPSVTEEFRKKLEARLCDYLKEVAPDETRLLNEVAAFSDRVCIDEEITRLKSHLSAFSELVGAKGAIGKQMDFIVQEMNREINTIGSKNNDVALGALVVRLKNEIEKIREQIQNIE